MDWIEQLLGVSPDGGSGALELVYLGVAAFAVGAIVRWRVTRRRSRSSESTPSDGR
jgi:MYXO-CTERM domain-containing protein